MASAPSTPGRSFAGASSRRRPARFISGSEKKLVSSSDQPSVAVHSGTCAWRITSAINQHALPTTNRADCR